MTTLITNATLVDKGKITKNASIFIEDGKIAKRHNRKPDRTLDASSLFVSPGFIELHTHGAGGYDFMDGTKEAYLEACHMHLLHGTTTIYPTTLASSREELEKSINTFKEIKDELNNSQFVPGLHLEGPYFALNQKGGQDPRYIRNPNEKEYKEIISLSEGSIKRWSIAPELKGALEMGDYLVNKDILPSIAHTDATYDETLKAIKHGYRHVTHLYSCTSTITRKSGFRVLGVTEASYCLDELTVELIADGCHLPPELLRMIVKCKGKDKISLISDSLRVAGLNTTHCRIGSGDNGRDCIIEDGVVKMPDRQSFAGSMATSDRLLRTMWKMAKVPLEDTITMMTENPARVMHIDDKKGTLDVGKDADILFFDNEGNIKKVLYRGEEIE